MAHPPVIALPLLNATENSAADKSGGNQDQKDSREWFFHDAIHKKFELTPAKEYGLLLTSLSKSEENLVRFT